ncbi:hypothetical protein ACFYPA_25690 [Streptomyces sp. NPDC005775]|uniref:hypothetical protein n=1 Tax=unclassified Streptomyces TaxID=2593676 RepID=UPI0033F02485
MQPLREGGRYRDGAAGVGRGDADQVADLVAGRVFGIGAAGHPVPLPRDAPPPAGVAAFGATTLAAP